VYGDLDNHTPQSKRLICHAGVRSSGCPLDFDRAYRNPNTGRLSEACSPHEETRTPDLYRVKHCLTNTFNNIHGTGRKRKPLKRQIDHNKTFLIVHELCMEISYRDYLQRPYSAAGFCTQNFPPLMSMVVPVM
jgi:hypothetical protein